MTTPEPPPAYLPQSNAERFALLGAETRAAQLSRMSPKRIANLEYDWSHWRRDSQATPKGFWRTWLVMAGRGFGKTRMGAEWVRSIAEGKTRAAIAIVGATYSETRQIMVEGDSGLLAITHPDHRPDWEPSLRRLTWKNGTTATVFSASEPDTLRGPQHSHAWCDEIAKWDRGVETWDMLGMTMRLGGRPRIVATTTPRANALMHRLMGEAPRTAITMGKSTDNRANVSRAWLSGMNKIYGGTRLGRQELDGEMIVDVEGALWSRALIEAARFAGPAPPLIRTVIGVDPPASRHGDACGIIVVGLGHDGRAYVIADESVRGASPEGWAHGVSVAAARWNADRVIAEVNQGGNMVEAVLRGANVSLPLTSVYAVHGKSVRAEPVATLYEAGRVSHVGAFPALEDELCGLMIGGGYTGPTKSPDRADALVWALTELMLGRKAGGGPSVRRL